MSKNRTEYPQDLFPIGKILKTRGLKGEVRVFLYNVDSNIISQNIFFWIKRDNYFESYNVEFSKKLETILDYVPIGSIVLDYQIPDACNSRWELIFDCYDARSTITAKNHVFSSMLYNPLPVNRLYLDRNELSS